MATRSAQAFYKNERRKIHLALNENDAIKTSDCAWLAQLLAGANETQLDERSAAYSRDQFVRSCTAALRVAVIHRAPTGAGYGYFEPTRKAHCTSCARPPCYLKHRRLLKRQQARLNVCVSNQTSQTHIIGLLARPLACLLDCSSSMAGKCCCCCCDSNSIIWPNTSMADTRDSLNLLLLFENPGYSPPPPSGRRHM